MAGYEGIITPYNTKDFEAMVEDVRGHFNGNATHLTVVGVDLRRELPRARNVHSRLPLGADLHMAAWQIARQIAQASAAQTASAAALGRAYEIYVGSFTGRRPRDEHGRFNAA